MPTCAAGTDSSINAFTTEHLVVVEHEAEVLLPLPARHFGACGSRLSSPLLMRGVHVFVYVGVGVFYSLKGLQVAWDLLDLLWHVH